MARLQVNPTRMELSQLKKRLVTARRGHKLLKDKRDDLMKKFLELVRQNKELREKVEAMISKVYEGFVVASAVMSPAMLEEAMMYPKQQVGLEVDSQNIMSVEVPIFKFTADSASSGDIFPYGLTYTSGELDDSIKALSDIIPYMLKLAQMEKSAQLLAEEIGKTRRRVNALEYVQIPTLQETIKYIKMKLDENERGNLARLMKVKDMMVKEQIEAAAAKRAAAM